jgi:tRNA threonylcarbamoyladenosine biosynthesis protein TsaE
VSARKLTSPSRGEGDRSPAEAGVFRSTSPEETTAIGERIGAGLAPGTVVLLVGPLGAGKTVIAKGIARALGITETVVSPTYTIVSEYPGNTATLFHVDLYRVEGREQQENLGLDDIFRGDGVVLVEWGEKLEPGLARGALRIAIDIAPDGSREIRVGGAGG